MGALSYSGTAASNTSIDGIGIAGSNSPANIDDALRVLAAADANFVRDLGGPTAGGSADALTLSLNDAATLPAYFDGMLIGFIASNDNATTSPTLNVDSVGAKAIKKAVAGVETALAAGDIQSGGYYLARYRSAWASAAGAFQLVDMNGDFSNVTVSGTLTVTNGAVSFSRDNSGLSVLRLFNTADNSNVQVLRLDGDRATPTDGDAAYISLQLSDSGGTQTEFARQKWIATDVTDATEDGAIEWSVMKAGTVTAVVGVDATGLTYSNNASANAYQLLGTITTTSGATQSLTSLTLTNYKFLRLVWDGVSHDSGSNQTFTLDSISFSGNMSAANTAKGFIDIDLTTGIAWGVLRNGNGSDSVYVGDTAYTTASTSITIGVTGGVFDAGTVKVYGI